MYFCTWGTTSISGTIPSVNLWPSWSYMANIVNYRRFNHGACTGFWQIYTFFIHVHYWSCISYSTNQTLVKSGFWTNYATQAVNRHKALSIKPTWFILSMFPTKGNRRCWHKVFKHVSSITKTNCDIFVLIPKHQKWPLVYVPSAQKIVSSHGFVFYETFSSALAYPSFPN